MSHPLHKPRQVVECSYVFCITADIDGEYWDIPLKESETTREFVKKNLWPVDAKTLTVELSLNNKNAILTFPDGVIKTVQINPDEPIEPTKPSKVERIKDDIETQENRSKLHEVLAKLGISFDIDFHPYREDSDYLTVYLNGKAIHSGTTDDLHTGRGK